MSIKALFGASALITIGMLSGRLLGLLREMLLASQFGIDEHANIAIALLIIPDFITSALIGSAASAALIPAFSDRPHNNGLALLFQSLMVSTITMLLIALMLFAGKDAIFALVSNDPTLMPRTSRAFSLALCSLPLSAATAVLTAWLQHRGRFMAPAFATAMFNSIIIATLLIFPTSIVVLAGGIFVAALMRLNTHAVSFLLDGEHVPKSVFKHWELDKKLLKTYAATAGNGIFSMLPFYVPFAVIAAGDSSLALFNYSFKLVALPTMLLQTVIQMVLLPYFVKLRKNTEPDGQPSDWSLAQSYGITLQLGWAVSFAACLCLMLASHALAQLCFGYGKMPAEGVAQIATLFDIGIWAIPGMVLTSIWQQILYASGRTKAPLTTSMTQAIMVIPLCSFGYHIMGAAGVLAGYAALQFIPIFPLARDAFTHDMIPTLRPSNTYGTMSAVMLVAFVPMAWIFAVISLPPLVNVALAGLIGLILLASGLATCRPVREWTLQKIRTENTP